MSHAKRIAGVVRLTLTASVALASGGCAIANLLSGGVRFNEVIEGELTYDDDHGEDSNDLMFYWDSYQVRLADRTSYTLELWTDPDVPIHFECDQLGKDLGAWSDGDATWDGYLSYAFPASFSGKLEFDFYVRADNIGDDSWYEFRINDE